MRSGWFFRAIGSQMSAVVGLSDPFRMKYTCWQAMAFVIYSMKLESVGLSAMAATLTGPSRVFLINVKLQQFGMWNSQES